MPPPLPNAPSLSMPEQDHRAPHAAPVAQLGRREAKKLQTRAALVEGAARLFSEHGFDNVTIAQIAKAAGVSTATVTNYFALKEDLAFAATDEICAAWVSCVRRRPVGQTPFGAIREQLVSSLLDEAAIADVLAFQAVVESSRTLVARQRLVWDRLELAVGQVLAFEAHAGRAPWDLTARLAAAQMVAPMRLLWSAETCAYLEAQPAPERVGVLAGWLEEMFGLMEQALGTYLPKGSRARPGGAAAARNGSAGTVVDPGSMPPTEPTGDPVEVVPSTRIGLLAEAVAADPRALDRFWTEVATTSTPLVEPIEGVPDELAVTFVWRGATTTQRVSLRANKLYRPQDPDRSDLVRLDGTDVWHLTYRLPSDWRGSYLFAVSDAMGETLRDDPWNPARLPQPPGPDKSVASLPDAPPQPHLLARPGVARGTVSEHRVPSDRLGDQRRVWVYEPPGAGEAGEMDLLVLLDGDVWAESLPVRFTLDNLLADGLIRPTLALLVDSVSPALRSRDLACREAYAGMLAKELLAWAAQRWPIAADPARATIAGQSLGGLTALYTALQVPGAFGNVVLQSGSFWWRNGTEGAYGPEWLTSQVASAQAAVPLFCYQEVGIDEGANLAANRRMRDALERAGHEVVYREYAGGHDRACWRGGLSDGLARIHAARPVTPR